jgi:N-acetylglucosamine-6-sulfatase
MRPVTRGGGGRLLRPHIGKRTRERRLRRRWVTALAAVISVMSLTGCTAMLNAVTPRALGAPPAQSGKPNVIFVLTDDLSWNLIPFMPQVQQMQRDGATFNNYFVTDSLCCPSRASMLTGRFPHNTGVFTNSPPDGGFNVFRKRGGEQATFGTALQAGGYHTAFMGKYLNGYQPDRNTGSGPYVPPGWNDWAVAGNGYPGYNYDLNVNGQIVHHGKQPSDYMTDVLADHGSKVIDQAAAAGTPFAMEIAPFTPHGPSTPAPRDENSFPGITAPRTPAFNNIDTANPPPWLGPAPPLGPDAIRQIDESFRKRVQSVQAIDAMIGKLRQQLVAKGLDRNTYLVFGSDNGFHLGEHRLKAGKQTAFDTDIRVPLMVTGPGVPAGQKVDEMAANIDLAPTFAEIGGTAPPPDTDGRSLLPLLRGQDPPDWRKSVLIEHHGPNDGPDDPDAQRPDSGTPPTYQAIRTPTELYAEYVGGQREYYDLTRDPDELHNVADRLPEDRVRALHDTVAAIANCRGTQACEAAARRQP